MNSGDLEAPGLAPKDAQPLDIYLPKVDQKSGLEGTVVEALNTVDSTIDRLNRLGSTIRAYSTASLESRVSAFTEQHGDENYTELAKHIIQFKYHTAPPSLQDQLAQSMSVRRQRLRYMRKHQQKLANRSQPPKVERQVQKESAGVKTVLLPVDETSSQIGPESAPPRVRFSTSNADTAKLAAPSTHTRASSFVQTPSLVHRLRLAGDGAASVVSSSKESTTFMAEDLDNYPPPPKREEGKPEPQCPYCFKPLRESELKTRNWR